MKSMCLFLSHLLFFRNRRERYRLITDPKRKMGDNFLVQMNLRGKDDGTPDGSLSSIHRVFGDPLKHDVKVC